MTLAGEQTGGRLVRNTPCYDRNISVMANVPVQPISLPIVCISSEICYGKFPHRDPAMFGPTSGEGLTSQW